MKTKQTLVLISWIVILCLWVVSCTPQQGKPVVLTVSAAAVFRNVMPEIDKLYKQEKQNVFITYNISGGGVLKKQIEQGAPVDIYIPGSARLMDGLQAKGFIISDTRQEFMGNEIVLIVPNDSTAISSFKDLTSSKVKRVALGTENIDAGIYTKQALTFMGIYDKVKRKGVFEEHDVQQILKYVESKNADAGITFLTEGKRSNKVRIVAITPENSHTPAISYIAILKKCQNVPEAKEFIQFLKSNKVAPVFEKYGFKAMK